MFLESCREIAQRFVQTVVIVDDQAFPQRIETPQAEVVPPPIRGLAPTVPDEDSVDVGIPVEDEQPAHGLDAGELSRQFASIGIVCAAYAPLQSGEPGQLKEVDAINTAKLARHADVVVVDWLLDGRSSSLAIGLIRSILDADRDEGGRLRLIAVYTGQDDLSLLRGQLLTVLQGAGHNLQLDTEGAAIALRGKHQRLVFLNKAEASISAGPNVVSVTELPSRLVNEFATMTQGIMPGVALASIAAIREGTHFLLAKFDTTLDGTLAAHRALLPEPADAAAYAFDLIAKELSAILEIGGEMRSPASLENMEAWLDHEQKASRFRLRADLDDLPMDKVKGLLRNGATDAVIKDLAESTAKKIGKDKIWTHLPFLYCGADVEPQANHAFARLACLRREAFGETYLPKGWRPMLTLGTLLFEEGSEESEQFGMYHVCVQALCDSVRLKEPRFFPLLPLKQVKVDKKFSLAARLPDTRDVWLALEMYPYKMIFPEFAPDTNTKTVRGVPDPSKLKHFYFTPPGKAQHGSKPRKFLWLGDLRPTVAQRIAHELASRVGRIGLDEYEWLRLKAQ